MDDPPKIGVKCARCGGLMVYERFTQETNRYQTAVFWGWRCVICGNIVDQVIIQNKKRG